MAQVFDLGNVLSTAQNIQGARLQNQARQQTFDANVLAQDVAQQQNVLLQQYMANPTPEIFNAIAASSPDLASKIQGLETTSLAQTSAQQGIEKETFRVNKENAVIAVKGATNLINSADPKRFAEIALPELVEQMRLNPNIDVDSFTNEDWLKVGNEIIMKQSVIATAGDDPVVPLSPGGKVQRDVSLGFLTPGQAAEGTMTAFDQKVAALVRAGVPENIAIGIQAGQFMTTVDPVTRAPIVVDISTGELVFDGGQTQTVAVEEGQPLVVSETPLNISESLGAGGVIKSGVNKIVDLFGGDLPFEETSVATAVLSNLNNETIQIMRSGIAGRPNVDLQRRIEKLLVEPNEIFGGEQEAKNKFESIVETVDVETNRLQKQLDSGKLRPVTADETRGRISELKTLSGKYKDILTNLDQNEKGDIMRFFN
jgi:hypothetical protein